MTFWILQYLGTNLFKWNAFVKLLPLWLAPNMVTLLGFICVLINVLLLQIYIPDLVGPVRRYLADQHSKLRNSGTILGILQFRFWLVDVSQA